MDLHELFHKHHPDKRIACIARVRPDKTLAFETTQSPVIPPAGDEVYTADGSPPIATYSWTKLKSPGPDGKIHVTYSIVIPQGEAFTDIPNTEDIVIAVNSAFTVWHIYGNIVFDLVPFGNHPDIAISFSLTDPIFVNDENVMAYTFFPGTSPAGTIFQSVYNAKLLWSIDGKYNFAYNINETLRHELGHSWGAVHTTNPADIMYPFYHNDLKPTQMDIYQVEQCCGVRIPPLNPEEAQNFFILDSKLGQFPDAPALLNQGK